MLKYQSLYTLNHLENLIVDGGERKKNNYNTNDNNAPFFSIITVVKNSTDNIETTIKSVVNQSFKNFEYIIIDGNSTDGTLNKIKSYDDKVTYWCSLNDKGIYDAMNYGLKLASGKVIGILNSGDTYENDSLKIVKKYFQQQEDLSYLFGTVKRHYLGNNVLIKYGFNKKRIKYNFDAQTSHSSGFFIKSNTQKKIGLYNTKFVCSADYDLFFKIFTNKNLNGISTKKNELIGVVQAGGYLSNTVSGTI